jgi:outer membrane protein assembly factor BamB
MKRFLWCGLFLLSGCQHALISDKAPVQLVWNKSINRGFVSHDGDMKPTVGQKIWAGDAYGNIGAYDKENAGLLWRTTLNAGLSAPLTEDRGQLAAPLASGKMVMLDSAKGVLLWSYAIKGRLLSAPVFSNQYVIVKTDLDHVYVINRKTGRLQWHYHNDAPSLVLYGSSQPYVSGDSIVVGFASGHLARMRLTDGKVIWARQVSEPSGQTQLARMRDILSTPIVADNRVYWAGFQSGVGAYTFDDGEEIWRYDHGSYYNFTFHDGVLFALTENQHLIAMNAVDGELLWENKQWQGHDTLFAPVFAMGHHYLLDAGNNLYEINPDDGKVSSSMWLGRNDSLAGGFVADQHALYALSKHGGLVKAISK